MRLPPVEAGCSSALLDMSLPPGLPHPVENRVTAAPVARVSRVCSTELVHGVMENPISPDAGHARNMRLRLTNRCSRKAKSPRVYPLTGEEKFVSGAVIEKPAVWLVLGV